jgi:L-lactate dehydrogenase (cytochrome)
MTSSSPAVLVPRSRASGEPRVLSRMLALDDFEAEAKSRIPRPIFGYINGGVETNASLRAFAQNHAARQGL